MWKELHFLNGYISNVTADYTVLLSELGCFWRIGTGYVTLTTGQYASVSFVTPNSDPLQYQFSQVSKTGNEVLVTLVEGGDYTGGTPVSTWNVNRIVGDANPPINPISGGTLTGGIEAPPRLIGGNAGGNDKPGGNYESSVCITLKPNTRYTLKLTAMGDVTLAAIFCILCT